MNITGSMIRRSVVRGAGSRLADAATTIEHAAAEQRSRIGRLRRLAACALAALVAGAPGSLPPAHADPVVLTVTVNQATGPSRMVLDERTGHLFVATAGSIQQSWVTTIDLRSGSVLRHTVVGSGLPLLAFDPQLDRVYASGLVEIHPFARVPPPPVAVLMALDGTTGRIVGRAVLSSQGNATGVDIRLGHLFVSGGGGRRCTTMTNCSTVASTVTMLDARTLKVLAVTPVGNSPQDTLVDERNGRVYVSTIDGIEVLDARTDRRLVHIPLQAQVLAVDEAANRVFLVDNNGELLLLDGRTSQVLSILPTSRLLGLGSPDSTMAVDPRTGHVYYATHPAGGRRSGSSAAVRLYEADGTTGRIVRSCPIGAHPSAVAVARSGMAVVADYGTNTATEIGMAGCVVVRRVQVASTPLGIAIGADGATGVMVIGSNTPRGPVTTSGNAAPPTSTTVTIAAL